MSELAIQASFNSGEWAPSLYARVDLAKYRSGAALLENFFVDYRGGASTRPGLKYILQCFDSAHTVRLIQFQASFNVGYLLEFGDHYIRFFIDGAPVLETAFNVTGASQAASCIVQIAANNFVINDWIFIDNIAGMTQLNGRYYKVLNVAGNAVTIGDLNGVAINSTGYTAYSSGGRSARIYKIVSPYAAADLALIKFAQNVNQMVICHPSYAPQVLTLIAATTWTILPITFGTTAAAPGLITLTTTLGAGAVSLNYAVTAIDANGQESIYSANTLGAIQDLRTTAGTIQVSWAAVAGAVGYNIYKSEVTYFGVVPPGQIYGYVGTVTGTAFIDSNIAPDFTQTPPIARNPFEGSGVDHVTVTVPGTYTTVPSASLTGAASTIAGSLSVVLQCQGTPGVSAGGAGYAVNDTILYTNGVVAVVGAVAAGVVTAFKAFTDPQANPGSVTSGSTPANPVVQISTSGAGAGATAILGWGVGVVQVLNSGAGYVAVPTVTFSAGIAAATAVLGATSNGYPSVPTFFQQRLVLAGPTGSPQSFYMSQPGAYYNYNISSPIQSDDAITGTLVSGQLNTIKSMISQTSGLLILTDKASWVINGGTNGTAISPSALVANAQSFNGASDVPPIVANFDVLYIQSKGSIVRDSTYNIYSNVFTGTDISVVSSHLFYGHQILQWAWSEEPFKIVWAVRNDGVALSLTFIKEQEFVGWAHSITNGSFESVAVVTEDTDTAGNVDAVYWVVARTINGNAVKYIERFVERAFPNGVTDAWCVDSGLQYDGVPATTFTGGEHLAGATITGLADGVVITPFVMPVNGSFTLGTAASKVTVGLSYTCNLETLALELGEPTSQGKVKKINHVDIRVADTLGLKIGQDFNHLVPMKDLVIGNVSSMLTGQATQRITDLVDGDARTYLSPAYTVPGQYCIRQDQPYPASVLGVFPSVTVGDEK
jgi:hypothetical protein